MPTRLDDRKVTSLSPGRGALKKNEQVPNSTTIAVLLSFKN